MTIRITRAKQEGIGGRVLENQGREINTTVEDRVRSYIIFVWLFVSCESEDDWEVQVISVFVFKFSPFWYMRLSLGRYLICDQWFHKKRSRPTDFMTFFCKWYVIFTFMTEIFIRNQRKVDCEISISYWFGVIILCSKLTHIKSQTFEGKSRSSLIIKIRLNTDPCIEKYDLIWLHGNISMNDCCDMRSTSSLEILIFLY